MGEFDTCERRWALHYLWYDFEYFDFPPELKRNCQFHSKLMGNEAFAGQVVHDVIDEHFRDRIEGRIDFGNEADRLADAITRAREIARQYIQHTEDFRAAFLSGQKPPQYPEGVSARQPLMRQFFQEGFDGAAKADFRKTVETALFHFFSSDLYKEIVELKPELWEMPDRGGAPWFLDQGIPVYANYDFALRMPERTILYDWKTGRLSGGAERDVREQLHTYAAYAMDKWRVAPEQITLRAVWLSVGKDQVFESQVDLGLLALMRQEWRRRYDELKRRRESARGHMEKLFAEFPTTGIKKKKCKYCAFRFCEGYQAYLQERQEANEGAAAT